MSVCTGLVKVVFATGTLAAGINMPARSTVIDSVSRRIKGRNVSLKNNELMQMAGRAGRRGFDTEGDQEALLHNNLHPILTLSAMSEFWSSIELILSVLTSLKFDY